MNEDGSAEGYTRSEGSPSSWDQVPPMVLQAERLSIDEIEDAIQRGLEPGPALSVNDDGRTYRIQLYPDEALLLGQSAPGRAPDHWAAEFAQVRTATWRDDSRREDVRQEELPVQPAFSVGDRVVFKGSDPILRKEWRVEALDGPSPYVAVPWGQPVVTCTIRRGSTVKTGVSLERLELVPPEAS